jgi:hypothetical protein
MLRFGCPGHWLVQFLLPVSALTVFLAGTLRYFSIQSALTKGMFPVARLTAASITFVLATVIIIVFAIILSARS